MKLTKKVLTLVLGLLLALSSAGLAMGQVIGEEEGVLAGEEAALGEEQAALGDVGAFDAELTDQVPFEEFFELGLEDPNAAQDFDYDAERTQAIDREVEMEEDKLFNALAIANQEESVEDIEFLDIADVTTTQTLSQQVSALSDFEEETVFAALALDVDAEGEGELESLAAAGGEVTRELALERTAVQDIDLERDETLFGIALANSADAELDWRDLADINREVVTDVSASQEVDLSTEDAFLALALGITGGEGEFGEEETILGGEEIAEEEGLVGGEDLGVEAGVLTE